MIRFQFGRGDVAVEGEYTVENGVIITTQRATLRGLAESLQSEIEYQMLVSPHAVAGCYAMAAYVLAQWGATVDTRDVPELKKNVEY